MSLTSLPTDEGWLYLASVVDLYHRKVVGWAISNRMTKQLTLDAIKQAVGRELSTEGLIFHSDKGSQYAAYDYQDNLREHGIRQSMSAKGDCYDIASMESFFATIQKELIYREHFKTRAKARLDTVDYIETWYNSRRIHSSSGDLSPAEYELKYYTSLSESAA